MPEATMGDAVSIMLVPDTREEADELFGKLSEGERSVNPCRTCSGATTTATSPIASVSTG